MFSKSLVVFAAVALAVNAQSSSAPPAPTGGLIPSSCVLGCVEPAARLNNCTGFADIPCVCQSGQFQADAGACLQQYCPTEYASAAALQGTVCSGYSVTGLTATPTPRTGFFSSLPATQTGTVPHSSGSSPKPTATGSPSPSPSSSTSTGITLEAGVGAFFGAIFAAVFAL